MKNLFTYGTLMCEDIMEEISGCSLSSEAGTLRGYSRRSVKKELYPGLVQDEKGSVEGIVYQNVPNSAWQRLDRFEGKMYARQLVTIECSAGATLLAMTYVVQPEFLEHLEESDWDFANFLRHGKTCFQKFYKGYEEI